MTEVLEDPNVGEQGGKQYPLTKGTTEAFLKKPEIWTQRQGKKTQEYESRTGKKDMKSKKSSAKTTCTHSGITRSRW